MITKKAHFINIICISLLIFTLIFEVVFSHNAFAADNDQLGQSSVITDTDFYCDKIEVSNDGIMYCMDSSSALVIIYEEGSYTQLYKADVADYYDFCMSPDEKELYIMGTQLATLTRLDIESGAYETINLHDIGIPENAILSGIACSPNNDIFIPDFSFDKIYIISPDNLLAEMDEPTGVGGLENPFCIDINSKGKIAIGSQGKNAVIFNGPYDDKFKIAATISAPTGQVETLSGAVIDEYNRIYHADITKRNLVMLDPVTGKLMTIHTAQVNEQISDMCATDRYVYAAVLKEDTTEILRAPTVSKIIGFGFKGIDALVNINNEEKTISVEVPFDTDISMIEPVIEVPLGADISLEPGKLYDFTNSIEIVVSTEIAGEQTYTITVTKEEAPEATPTPVITNTPESQVTETHNELEQTQYNTGNEYLGGKDEVFEEIDISSDNYEGSDGLVGFVIGIIIYSAILLFFIILSIALKKKKKNKLWLILLAIWIVVAVAFVLLGLNFAKDEVYPIYVEDAEYEVEDFEPYLMSEEQKNLINEYGKPDGFVLLITNGGRQETWFYYDEGLAVDFLAGIEIARINDSELADVDTTRTDYSPDDFTAGMSPSSALYQADADSFIIIPVEKEILDDGVLYYTEGMVLGFVDDELYYVETLIPED